MMIELDTTPLTLTEMQKDAYGNSLAKGFWGETGDARMPRIPEKIALIHSELSEALEEYRDSKPNLYFSAGNKPEGLGPELADAVIRIGDLASALGIDLSTMIRLKMKYNLTRPHKHGGKAI